MSFFLFPSADFNSTYEIDFQKYYDKGYRGLMFDIDNTIVEHDEPATGRCSELFEKLHAMGFKTCLISNNKDYRVKPLADIVKSDYVYKAGKPLKKGYIQGMEKMGTNRRNTIFIGDQIFTDIWGANNARVHSILVKPIAKHEEIQIILKRIPEKPIIALYKLHKKRRLQKKAKKDK
ncbi:MAG: HAD hydrolase-like protein [Lachnospiraceae bacterium]|nr:HAD hydrolase-like protein [Lachnospiraceae bacterium]